ncbi:hypothetical protein EV143_11831 [Flavobacterium chryseum]|uniref:hypothetical protein n=1 Tax=Flavobacterium sp. P3160 TaxID=2512113 RepID=UPI00105F36D9|nr:hypothetical protein [Flavobacterium sp. P3160]TDO68847.1 hypothetical protein EV143_11831 [Flavobacterium sp. P3160]
MNDPVTIVKATSKENTYFIFRPNGEEVTITLNDVGTIKTSHKLTNIEIEFLREEYAFFFKPNLNANEQ